MTSCKTDDNDLHKQHNGLKGKHMQIVTGQFAPVTILTRNSSGHVVDYSGLLFHHLRFLSQKLKFTYNIFIVAENTNGIKVNGTWNGIIGTLLRQEADIGLAPVAISLQRYEALDFRGRIGGDWTGILVRYPPPFVSFTSTLDLFSKDVWIGFLVSAVVVAGIFIVLTSIGKRLHNTLDSETSNTAFAWYLFGTFFSQGNRIPASQRFQQVLAATWCLAAFVFVNSYNCTLTSYMSVTYQKPDINSLKELAISTTYKANVLMGSIQEIDLLMSTNEYIKTIAARMKQCPDCRKFNSSDQALQVIKHDNYVAIMAYSSGRSNMQKHSSERGKCLLTMAKEKTTWANMFLAVPKTSPYKEEIERESLWFHAAGLREYWSVRQEKYPKQCELIYNNKGTSIKRSSNRIKLEQFYLPFLLLLGGYVLGLIQFFREHLTHCKR
ncbi:glutamate receptor ionotropic, delta-2-like [Daphnia carinata]|uniref:glutamate receptor ionotropic, delta-2-like n=1 Tax=Daphnia carinata TaxID=120202 RepID=UPI00286932DB|nr:glutamate receptor ionotropic, delta-2-like [Daphnia carinata]